MKPQVGQKKHQKSAVSDEKNAFLTPLRACSLIEFAQSAKADLPEPQPIARYEIFGRDC
jgi:hypothetical protein